jgi:hypothetical protein
MKIGRKLHGGMAAKPNQIAGFNRIIYVTLIASDGHTPFRARWYA